MDPENKVREALENNNEYVLPVKVKEVPISIF